MTATKTAAKFTKVGQNYTHPSGVTIVRVHPAMTRYAVLVPGSAPARFGSFAAARAAGQAAVAAL